MLPTGLVFIEFSKNVLLEAVEVALGGKDEKGEDLVDLLGIER